MTYHKKYDIINKISGLLRVQNVYEIKYDKKHSENECEAEGWYA